MKLNPCLFAFLGVAWIGVSGPAVALPPMQIDSSFDSGNIGPYVIDEANDEIEFSLQADGLNYTYWTHFTVSGVSGRNVTFRISNANNVPFLSEPNREAQLVYSYDGETWQRITDHALAGNTYSFVETFTSDTVRIATFFPFSANEMSDLVDDAALSPWATKLVLGASHHGRDIDLLTITNPLIPDAQKRVIYIVGRQHAAETSSSHMLQGLIEFLIADDSYAAGLRDGYVWQIVPMVNPDGVDLGNSRANAQGNDPNRDWHQNNHDSVEIDLVRAHLDSVDATDGVDLFIDWHSQMNDVGWYNFVYSPPGNSFFGTLSSWTDFDTEKAVGTSCSTSSCSSRGYATGRGLFVFVLEPTPHLVSWTIETLRNEGVNTAIAVNEHFGQFEPPLLVDTDFEIGPDSAELRADGPGLDWRESRVDDPTLLTLDLADVAGNETRKARLAASTVSNAYLTQRFGWTQTGTFSVEWEILVEEIVDLPGNGTDRAAWMLIGDDSDASSSGPNSDDGERFVYMAFARDGGGTVGQTMDLVARDRNDPWDGFTLLASGLTIGQWYRIRVTCALNAGSYEVYLDDALVGSVSSRQTKSSVSHISFAQWDNGAGTFVVDGDWAPPVAAGSVASLLVGKNVATDLSLTWGPSCLGSDIDYAVYEGVVGDFHSHLPVTETGCTTAGATNAMLSPGSGRRYYLVVPQATLREGSYGIDGEGTPRSPSSSACRLQLVGDCAGVSRSTAVVP